MGRREYHIRLVCAESGCRETSFTVAQTREEEREIRERYARNPYQCTRHTQPEKVLSPDNPKRVTVLTARQSEHPHLDRLFWDGSSGFSYGPGFKAFAQDFPPGTQLVVTAEVVLPDGPGGE